MLSRLFNLPIPTNTVPDELGKLVDTLTANNIQVDVQDDAVVCNNIITLQLIDLKNDSEFFGNVTLANRQSNPQAPTTFNIFVDELLLARPLIEEKVLYKFKKIQTIGARKCQLVTVPTDCAVSFFETHHIHNTLTDFLKNNSRTYHLYGLEYQGNLVEVALFEKRDDNLWMHLLATSKIAVAGGLTKLISYAIKQLSVTGKVYTKSRNHISPAPYFNKFFTSADIGHCYWVTDYAVKVRSDEFFKNQTIFSLYEKSRLTELEFIKKLKLDIVWDFGNLVWEADSNLF